MVCTDLLPAKSGASNLKERTMKKDIHPKYEEATITCACGYVLKTRSTVKNMSVNTF